MLVLGSVVLGLIAANTSIFKNVARPVWFKFTHNFIGIAGYVIGMVSLIYGYKTNWFKFYYSSTSIDVAIYATAIVCAWSLYSAFASGYHQLKAIFFR